MRRSWRLTCRSALAADVSHGQLLETPPRLTYRLGRSAWQRGAGRWRCRVPNRRGRSRWSSTTPAPSKKTF